VNYVEISNLQEACSVFLQNPTATQFESFVLNDVPGEVKNSFLGLMNAWNSAPTSVEYKNNAISLIDELMNYKTSIPTVGASGAVFGVLLAFGMMFPNSLIYVFFFIPMPAKFFVVLYGLFELYSGLQNNPGDNVAHFAHLGGMLFGFILIRYWKKQRKIW
jgi:membrane associated rhomboid family serine protease